MSTNDDIEDALTRHQVFLQRYAKGREDAAKAYIAELIREAQQRLGFDFSELSYARQEQVIADLLDRVEELNGDYTEEVIAEAMDLLEYEVEFNQRALVDAVGAGVEIVTPAVAAVQAGMLSKLMQPEPTKGFTIRDALRTFGVRKSQQILQIIRDGVTLGRTTAEIARSVRDAGPMMSRQATTLTRTITNHVGIQARNVVMRENRDITDSYKWVATLDSRTSLICASRDQTVYKDIEANPKPPAHFNCRSTIVPVIKPEFDLGLDVKGERPSVGASGPRPVAGDTSYGSWLRKQPQSFQVAVLGVTRAKLFKQGQISIGRFVDDAGRTLTLDELRKLEPLTFERLGI